MKALVWAGVLVLLLPSLFAFPCEWTSDVDSCEAVVNSNLPEEEKELAFSSLLYAEPEVPRHDFIETYNSAIKVTSPPTGTEVKISRHVRDAWISQLVIFPSVSENESLYVPSETNVLTKHHYELHVPPTYYSGGWPGTSNGDCMRKYYLQDQHGEVRHYVNSAFVGSDALQSLAISEDSTIRSELAVDVALRIKHYSWYTWCRWWGRRGCRIWGHKCKYRHSTYENDGLRVSEEKQVKYYDKNPTASVEFTDQYMDTTYGTFDATDHSTAVLSFKDSWIKKQSYYYDLVFENKPYYFAYLRANEHDSTTTNNIYYDEERFSVKNTANCRLFAYNHFNTVDKRCDDTTEDDTPELVFEKEDHNLAIVFYVLIFLFVLYLFYKLLRSQWKKIAAPFFIILFCLPFAFAAEPESECGLTNLGACVAEKFFDMVLYIVNAPLQLLLTGIKNLLTADVFINVFHHVWSVLRYIMSFFYIFLFLYAGYILLLASESASKRYHAKIVLQKAIVMIVLVQGSFFLYGLLLDMSTSVNTALLNMVDPSFFLLVADSQASFAVQLIFAFPYLVTLLVSLILLTLRYIAVSIGVIFTPIALFCYFIPPLEKYGKQMLTLMGMFMFITTIHLLIIIACSLLIQAPVFENFKILFMIVCFTIINYTLVRAIDSALQQISGTSMEEIGEGIAAAGKYVAALFA